jgi:hypothetical protein
LPPILALRVLCLRHAACIGELKSIAKWCSSDAYAVLALKSFREHDCAPGAVARLSIEVKSPSVTHTLVTQKVEDWVNGGARSPKEAIETRRLKELLGA